MQVHRDRTQSRRTDDRGRVALRACGHADDERAEDEGNVSRQKT